MVMQQTLLTSQKNANIISFLDDDEVCSMTIKEATTFLWVLVCNEIYEIQNLVAYPCLVNNIALG